MTERLTKEQLQRIAAFGVSAREAASLQARQDPEIPDTPLEEWMAGVEQLLQALEGTDTEDSA